MQIMENVYIDIGVKGSSSRSELNYDQLKNFELVETAGTSLPYICFSFFTFDGEWAKQFVKNNTIELKIGQTQASAETFTVNLIDNQLDTDPSGASWTITGGGFIGDTSFITDKSYCKAYLGNSLTVVRKVIRNFSKLKKDIQTNITTVNEKIVRWRQSYETASSFLVKTILHMDIQPSFPLFTFDKYGTFHIRDYNKIKKDGYVWKFIPAKNSRTEATGGEIQYINNFNVENFQTSYNLYSGYDRLSEILKSNNGVPNYNLNENSPIIAATEQSDTLGSGNRVDLNKIQSDNVHDTYMESFAYNTNKLVALSSIQGVLQIVGYHPYLKPTELVYVQTNKDTKLDSNLEGLYFIDTIVFVPNFQNGTCLTYVYVTRDNWNNVEDAVTEKKKKVNVTKKALQTLFNAISETRIALATCSQIMDGTFIEGVMSFLVATKYNLLRMFSIAGVPIDFNAQVSLIQTLLGAGNNIMNILLSTLLPAPIAYMLRDILIDQPITARRLIDKYIAEYIPFEVQGLISGLVDALFGVHGALNSIAKDNGITVRRTPEVSTRISSAYNEPESIVNSILEEFENNTTGIDLPLPVVTLTESQQLMPRDEIKELVANETIANLTDLGYMDGLSDTELQEFKGALTGETEGGIANYPSLINKINVNAGNTFLYRFWGTYGASNEAMYAWTYNEETVYTKTLAMTEFTRFYNEDYSPYMGSNFKIYKKSDDTYVVAYETTDGDIYEAVADEDKNINSNALSQLTDFYINKGYKDKYRTLPCTKLISATGNQRLYFACPQKEENIKFYINSRRVVLDSFPIDLGYVDARGNKIMYNVYYTTTGYNSNSTMLEVRQG